VKLSEVKESAQKPQIAEDLGGSESEKSVASGATQTGHTPMMQRCCIGLIAGFFNSFFNIPTFISTLMK